MVVASTLARVKARIPVDASNTAYDTDITALLAGVSREVEQYIGYDFERKARTELYSVDLHQNLIHLTTVPLVSVSTVKVSAVRDFTTATALTSGTNYRARLGMEGALWFDTGILIEGFETVEIVYTAGLGVDTAAVIAVAPDLAMAIDLQTAEEWRRGRAPSTQTQPGPKSPRTFTAAHGFLPRVEELLVPYRRMLLPQETP